MKPDRWQQIKQLFDATLSRTPQERVRFLDEACASDEALRREVETLLASHAHAASFMETPAVAQMANVLVGDARQLTQGERVGHYEIIAALGAGGMGEVYLAQDTKLQRKVALKLLPVAAAADAQANKRLLREAQTAATLDHPHICAIHEIGEAGGRSFICMQYVEGETLAAQLQRVALSVREAVNYAVQIADALTAAHAHKIIHRDIKPANIIVTLRGQVKVLDFGLAKFVTARQLVESEAETASLLSAPGTVLGTVPYMSPEQVRGESLDERSDVFSFGVVLYEMLSGCQPFACASTAETTAAVLTREPPPLVRYAADTPAELQRIARKCLEKKREERYQTAQDLLLDLRRLQQRLEVEAELERRAAPALPARAMAEGRAMAETIAFNAAPTVTDSAAPSTANEDNRTDRRKAHKLAAIAALLLLTFGGAALYYFTRGKVATEQTSNEAFASIAVLPFENVTHDQNTEYLSDGVTESLINSLSQLPHIKVIARSSVFRYKNQTPDLQEVARQLNVQAVLTGRVLVQGDTLGVSVEMTNTQDNTQLWGERYTRKAADIFAVQDEIARQVTDTLRVRLTGGQQEQVTKRYTENAEAYRLYLQGRFYMNEFSEENLNRAIPFFDQAIALDPRYALAYAARGESFFSMGDLNLPMSEAMRKAKQDCATALSIDDKLVEARTTQAVIKYGFDWDFAGAEADFKQAIALNPNYAEAHHQYTYYLAQTGRPMEGLAEIKLAQQLDPVNPSINVDACVPYELARQFDQCIAQSRQALEMFPNFFLPHMTLGMILFHKGDYSTGIAELQKAKAMEPTPQLIGFLGYAYAKSGRTDEARKLLAELKELSKRRYVASYWIAMIYVGLDEKDEAFVWLEKAYQERSWWLLWIKMDPMVDSLRSDPRFTDLMRRIGFPQ